MAATSMMKEYVKRQLKYWVDNFKDDQLPRDFNNKNFSRPQITLYKIALKPDKIAALLQVPAPLIVTRATCSELTIKVPSWQLAEKFVQEPLSLRLGDLFVDVKHIDECDDHVRSESVARARAASMEPDPLGSIASMYQFATIIHERLELLVENISFKLYEKHTLRVRMELARFHARTTNALWQDMRDLTDCVDRSPDDLLKTRFKFVSAQCNVYLHDNGPRNDPTPPPPLRLMQDHAIAMRMTLFGHRTAKQETWEVLSRVVDLNLETLRLEMDTTQVQHVYALYATLTRWMHEATTKSVGDTGLLPHQVERIPLSPSRQAGKEGGTKATDNPQEEMDETTVNSENTFALQITVRFTAHMLLRVRSERRSDFLLAVIAQHAALNWIQHNDADASTELQLTVHDVSVRHKDKVLFHIKPAREVLQVKRLPGATATLFIKWHLHKLECHLENEIAKVANELFHSLNEIEQAATITCGTCHHKIPLDAIASHVCAPGTASNATVNGNHHSSDGMAGVTEDKPSALLLDSTQIPKLRIVLALDELELVTDSFLFRSVQDLVRLASSAPTASPPSPSVEHPLRRFVVTMKDWSVSTESKEFVGDAIFVPVLPLAFQMLECTIRSCGCVQRQQKKQKQKQQQQRHRPQHGSSNYTAETPDASESGECSRALPRWPDRVFAELGHFSMRAMNNTTKTETFFSADGASLRLSFSDGRQICRHSTPQMSCFFHIERIRCQMEHSTYQRMRRVVLQLQDPLDGYNITALTLFFAVMEIRNIELTLLREAATTVLSAHPNARFKAQFRHVGGVADNHQGHLSLQTNCDFRSVLESEAVRFNFASSDDHQSVDEAETIKETNGGFLTKREQRRRRGEALQNRSAQRIQRVFRGFVACRRRQVDEELRRLTHDDDAQTRQFSNDQQGVLKLAPDSPSTPQRKSIGKPPPLFGATDDLAALSPKKMVAAANVLKDGVFGFVKAKQQMLETEMTELAMQSKESASRFIPKYSAVKNLLSPKAAALSPTMSGEDAIVTTIEVRDVEVEDETARDVDGNEGQDGDFLIKENASVESQDGRASEDEQEVNASEQDELMDEEAHELDEGEKDKALTVEAEDGTTAASDKGDVTLETPVEEPTCQPSPPLSATETLLASLPPIVRLMVQVEEHRLCVPIDPRTAVTVLCSEIVRRFNEMFAHHGVITHVTLQNPQGGVFAASDIIGLVCDINISKSELLFAYPHDHDAGSKSVVHIDTSTYDPPSPTTKSSSFRGTKTTHVCAFARCSKLPLPLVVAMLANESERDLLRHALHDGSVGGEGDDWPELALNASFLDPTRDMLQVEVRWPGVATKRSLEVTNRDAFLLCLQQLGLCTSRENGKHVGKVLRDRLKMDVKNPLIRAACHASPEFQRVGDTDSEDGSKKEDASYASLKEIVQEDFGVYTRMKE